MKNISAWAIRHPVTPIVLFVVLFFLGVVAFIRLPINLKPDISFPLVNVTISQPGAAPAEMETQIAQKVEGSIASIGNVRNITTYIIEGEVNIVLEFQIGTPIDRAVTDVRDAVAKVRNDLPQGIMEPLVQRENVDGGAISYYAVTTTAHARGAQLVHRQYRHQALAGRSRASRKSRAAAASAARSASSSIRRGCRRSASRRSRSTSSCGR